MLTVLSSMLASPLTDRWVWVVDGVFAFIITLGFQKLDETLSMTAGATDVAFHLLIAIGFIAFVVYDIGIYHILIRERPYKLGAWSALRYVLDLSMAFCLLVILLRGLARAPESEGLMLLVALTGWHVSAALWHVVAGLELNGKVTEPRRLVPHLVFVGLYWTTAIGVCSAVGHGDFGASCRHRNFLVVLSLELTAVSVYRSAQLVKYLSRAPKAIDEPVLKPSL